MNEANRQTPIEGSLTAASQGGDAASLVRLIGINKVYEETGSRVHVLTNMDFSVLERDFIAVRGASGVGKSTLLHILGLLDTPTSGRVEFAGKDVRSLGDQALSRIRGREIGFVFQFHHLLPDFTANENVLLPKRISSGGVNRQDEERAEELLSLVGVAHRRNHLPSELSGGERQRVAVARALMNGPRLLLCDEPSGNLDARNSESLHRLLTELNSGLGLTIVVMTHDTKLAKAASSRFLMESGSIRPDEVDAEAS